VIITRSKADLVKTTNSGEEVFKATFDVNQYKHSSWAGEDDDAFKNELRTRIAQTIRAVEQSYFSL